MDLIVGVFGDIVRDSPRQKWPFCWITCKVMILDIFLIRDQHFELQFCKFIPEREDCFFLGDELMGHHLLLYGGLVLVILGVPVLLHVPHGVRLVYVSIGSYLVLHKAPIRIILSGEPESSSGVDVDQSHLRVDRVPDFASCVSVDDVNLPEILGGHGNVVVDVARDLLVCWRDWSSNVMGV